VKKAGSFKNQPLLFYDICCFQFGMFQVMLSETPALIIICLTFSAFPPFAVIVTLVRLVSSANAYCPMLVTLSGTVSLNVLLVASGFLSSQQCVLVDFQDMLLLPFSFALFLVI